MAEGSGASNKKRTRNKEEEEQQQGGGEEGSEKVGGAAAGTSAGAGDDVLCDFNRAVSMHMFAFSVILHAVILTKVKMDVH